MRPVVSEYEVIARCQETMARQERALGIALETLRGLLPLVDGSTPPDLTYNEVVRHTGNIPRAIEAIERVLDS